MPKLRAAQSPEPSLLRVQEGAVALGPVPGKIDHHFLNGGVIVVGLVEACPPPGLEEPQGSSSFDFWNTVLAALSREQSGQLSIVDGYSSKAARLYGWSSVLNNKGNSKNPSATPRMQLLRQAAGTRRSFDNRPALGGPGFASLLHPGPRLQRRSR